jgi:hypothetical protein
MHFAVLLTDEQIMYVDCMINSELYCGDEFLLLSQYQYQLSLLPSVDSNINNLNFSIVDCDCH